MGLGSAIKAGAAYVELYLHDSKFAQGLNKIAGKTKALGSQIAGVGGRVAAAGAAIAGPIVAAAQKFADFGDTLNKMAARTGASVEALSELKFAAEQSGASLEDVENGFRRMQKTIGDAADGTATAVDALAAVGLSAAKLEHLTPEDQFTAIADALSKIQDPTARASAAMDLFGRSGTKLLPLFADGAAGMEKLREEARRLGITMSTEDAQAAADYTDAMNRVKTTLASAWQTVGAAVAPVLTDLADRLAAGVGNLREWINDHREMIVTALKVGATIAAAGTAIAAIGGTLIATASVVSTVTSAVTGLSAAFAFLAANPVVLALAGIAAATVALSVALDNALAPTVELGKAQEDLLGKTDALRKADQGLFERLEQLGEKQKLTSAELTEAESIVARLEDRYGDLGLSVDKTTGQVLGLADAQDRLTAAMAEGADAQIKSAQKEHMANIRILGEAMDEIANSKLSYGKKLELTEEYRIKQKQEQAAYDLLTDRRRALKAGHAEALTGDKIPEADAAAIAAEPEDLAALAALEERNAQRLHDQKIAQIEDEKERELAKIRDKYAAERAEAQKLADELAAAGHEPEAARARSAVAQIDQAEANEIQAVENQALEDQLAARVAELKDKAAARGAYEDDVARLEIQANKEGLDEKLALLELDRQKALEEAQAEGIDTGLVNQKFDLLAQLAEQEAQVPAAAAATGPRGTFSADAAKYLGSSSQPLDRIAKASEESAQANKQSAKANQETAENTRFTFAWT